MMWRHSGASVHQCSDDTTMLQYSNAAVLQSPGSTATLWFWWYSSVYALPVAVFLSFRKFFSLCDYRVDLLIFICNH